MSNSQDGKQFAVVTGASSGIGLELAKQFAKNGFDLLITSEQGALGEAGAAVRAAGGSIVDEVAADLATYEGVELLYERIRATGRPVDVIAINAGVGVGGDFARGTDLEQELNLIRLNVLSTVHLAKRVLTDMVSRGEGRVLFTASIASIVPTPFEAVYGASKAFILSFSESLRSELKDTNITITALMPGPTDTNFFHRAGMDDTQVGSEGKHENDPADVARQGFEALMAGESQVLSASLKTKLQGTISKVLPEGMVASMHRKMSAPGSANK